MQELRIIIDSPLTKDQVLNFFQLQLNPFFPGQVKLLECEYVDQEYLDDMINTRRA